MKGDNNMLRYKNLGNSVISVNLNNGYSVVAISIWDRGDNVYRTTLYLKGDTYIFLLLSNSTTFQIGIFFLAVLIFNLLDVQHIII